MSQELDTHALIADQDDIAGTGRAAECGLAALPTGPHRHGPRDDGRCPAADRRDAGGLAEGHAGAAAEVTMVTLSSPTRPATAGYSRDEAGRSSASWRSATPLPTSGASPR